MIAEFHPIASTTGQKTLMAATGIVLLGFVLGHLAGNLLFFAGPEALNSYSEFLQSKPAMLWGARIVLLFSVAVHMRAAIVLTLRNRAARPHPYSVKKEIETSFAARTMVVGGFLIILYVLFHLAHLTFGVVGPQSHFHDGGAHVHDVYGTIVAGFRNPAFSATYILSMIVLGLHIYHGAWSFLQTLGVSHPGINCLRKRAAAGLGIVIAAGYIAIPVAVLLGVCC